MSKYLTPAVIFYFLSFGLHANTLRPVNHDNEISKRSIDSLDVLHWKNRVFLVRDSGEPSHYEYILSTERSDINDRDVIWFVFRENDIVSNYPGNIEDGFSAYIKDEYFSNLPGRYQNRDAIISIGKDGSVKSIDESLNLKTLFALIDGMPMRQKELRQREVRQND